MVIDLRYSTQSWTGNFKPNGTKSYKLYLPYNAIRVDFKISLRPMAEGQLIIDGNYTYKYSPSKKTINHWTAVAKYDWIAGRTTPLISLDILNVCPYNWITPFSITAKAVIREDYPEPTWSTEHEVAYRKTLPVTPMPKEWVAKQQAIKLKNIKRKRKLRKIYKPIPKRQAIAATERAERGYRRRRKLRNRPFYRPLRPRPLPTGLKRKPDYYAGITDAEALDALRDAEAAYTLANLK